MNRIIQISILFWSIFFQFHSFGQVANKVFVEFIASNEQSFGFDKGDIPEFKEDYELIKFNNSLNYTVPFKSTGYRSSDKVRFVIHNKKSIQLEKLVFKAGNRNLYVDSIQLQGDTVSLILPRRKKDYLLEVHYSDQLVGKLNVQVYTPKKENLIIVPLTKTALISDSLVNYLNTIYSQAGLSFSVTVHSKFSSNDIENKTLNNPSKAHDRYTDQMTNIRDLYFEKNPNASKKAIYLFIADGFVDEDLGGYMVRNKSVGFIKEQDLAKMYYAIAQQLGFGIGSLNDSWKENGPEEGTTSNLMDINFGTHLTQKQWEALRAGVDSYSMYDDYEDVQTNNGIIAFYFWKEDQDGNIIFTSTSLMNSINRPFKKNQYSVYLEIDNFFYYTVFSVFGQLISVLHLISFIVFFLLSILLRRKLVAMWRTGFAKYRLVRLMIRIVNFGGFLTVYILLFLVINQGYSICLLYTSDAADE